MRDIQSASKAKVSKVLNIPQEELSSSDQDKPCKKCKDLDTLVGLLKEKCSKATTTKEKIILLTLAPPSWSIKKTVQEFQVSHYIVRTARELKKTNGILAVPAPKKGKVLSPQVVQRVVEFYESDEYSRMCPGQKEFVSVRINYVKVQKQKRLILINLKELYKLYKIKNPDDKIGFSKFCDLRPKWCVSVNSRGMHSVCVCQIHQNVKLLVSAIPGRLEYQDLLSKIVCSVDNRDCMMLVCEKCPGKSALVEDLSNTFTENEIDFEETITFKQWINTDRTTIATLQLPLPEFIEQVADAFDRLRQHHYITKSQSAYLRKLKEDLSDDTAIALLDFAENYSFLIQDAIQGFYWDNSQATLHPFVIYYKENDELKSLSTCVISDSLKHETSTVHAFITTLLSHLKDVLPHIKKIVYFSDGAASQYKNYKNWTNICFHKKDHGLHAEWHFFATSHGKSPCDGIGGTTKRLVARASLQATETNQILKADDMYRWVCDHIQGIKFFFVTDEQIQLNKEKYDLDTRYALSKTIAGTRSHHSFVPISESKLEMRINLINQYYNYRKMLLR
ncbi:uncharacterized protein [Antedon mediterranea]|uniref:uncharacterized protein n=1 Tax=Antedon mediterranea TaxID=105859 RepID=UPI003AF54865